MVCASTLLSALVVVSKLQYFDRLLVLQAEWENRQEKPLHINIHYRANCGEGFYWKGKLEYK